MARKRQTKSTRAVNKKRRAGTIIPAANAILNKGLDADLKGKTMYAPTNNLKMNVFSNKLTDNVGPFGTRWSGVLRYCDVFKLGTGALGIYNEYQFNLNSLFDPDRSGVGHQPLGYDQLAAIYSRYRVIQTKYRLTPMFEGLAVTPVGMVTYVNNSASVLGSVSYALESGYSTFQFNNVYTQCKPLKGTVKLNSLTGNSLEAYRSDDAYQAQVTASPSEIMILHVGIESNGGTASSVDYYLEMEFDCELWDPSVILPS